MQEEPLKTKKQIGASIAYIVGVLIICIMILSFLYIFNYLIAFGEIVLSLNQQGTEAEELWAPLNRGAEQLFLYALDFTQLISVAATILSGIPVFLAYKNLHDKNRVILGLFHAVILGFLIFSLQIYHDVKHPVFFEPGFFDSGAQGVILFFSAGAQIWLLAVGVVYFLLMMVFVRFGCVSTEHKFGLRAAIWHWYYVIGLWLLIYSLMVWRSHLQL